MLSTKEFTAEELAEAKHELDVIGVAARLDDPTNAYAVLGQMGMAVRMAADRYPDDGQLRAASAMYAAWRKLPAHDPGRGKVYCGTADHGHASHVERDDCLFPLPDPSAQAEDTGDRYSRGDTEEAAVPIKPDTLLTDLSDHHRDRAAADA